MPSALPAKSSNSISFGSLSSVGLPSLSYSYFVPEAVPTTCSGAIPYIFSEPMRAKSWPPPVTMYVLKPFVRRNRSPYEQNASSPPLQLAVVFSQEAGEAAKMIVVTVTEHEGIELGRLNAYEVGIVDQRFWCEAEIREDIARFRTAARLGVHRQAELTDQRLAWRFVAAN